MGYSFAYRSMKEKRSETMLAMIYQKDQAFPWVLLESPNFLISSRFTLGARSSLQEQESLHLCAPAVKPFICVGRWGGWKLIKSVCVSICVNRPVGTWQ